jgi:hypothetical protein
MSFDKRNSFIWKIRVYSDVLNTSAERQPVFLKRLLISTRLRCVVYQKTVVFAVMIRVMRNSLARRETDLSAQVDNIMCDTGFRDGCEASDTVNANTFVWYVERLLIITRSFWSMASFVSKDTPLLGCDAV